MSWKVIAIASFYINFPFFCYHKGMMNIQSQSEAMYQALWRLLYSSPLSSLDKLIAGQKKTTLDTPTSSVESVDYAISMARRLGEFHPRLPVGDRQYPLVHALSCKKILPVKWLEFFKQMSDECGLFEKIDGETMGSRIFKEFARQEFKSGSEKAFRWWIENAPSLDTGEVSGWIERLNNTPTNSSNSAIIESFMEALIPFSAQPSMENEARPQSRWSNSPAMWESIKESGKMERSVKMPSGQVRSMRDALRLGSGVGGDEGFLKWECGFSRPKYKEAPHGRSKALVSDWVLNENASVEERIRRMIAAALKTDRFLPELLNKANSTDSKDGPAQKLLHEMLAFKTPAGLDVEDILFLHHQVDTTELSKFMNRSGISENPEGALILREIRSVMSPFGEFTPAHSSYIYLNIDVRNQDDLDECRQFLVGDDSMQHEIVNYLVDGIVSRQPSAFFVSISKKLIENNLIESPNLCAAIEQALCFNVIHSTLSRFKQMSSYTGSSKKPDYAWADTAAKKMDDLRRWIKEEGLQIKLSAEDVDTLFHAWNEKVMEDYRYSNLQFAPMLKLLKNDLKIQGEYVSLSDRTPVASNKQTSRPRL